MTAWPQILIAAWLTFGMVFGAYTAIRPPMKRAAFIPPRFQRYASAGFALMAFGEAVTLAAGGFFSG